ncbi:hypothetical protein ACLBKU_15350 [Erythrobacter sp. NE805]|uniref:hypothetical protein n=1 Tax=Erythrobacter sp. NE805 TaxID=3389875 RepID=UPI00396AF574
MKFLNLLKSNVLLIGLMLGWVLLRVLEPLDRVEGWLCILYGMAIIDLDRRLNPAAEVPVGPWLPWNRMGAGEKLEYFFPAIIAAALGLLVIVLAVMMMDRSLLVGGIMGAMGLVTMGGAAWSARTRWQRRWAALEGE